MAWVRISLVLSLVLVLSVSAIKPCFVNIFLRKETSTSIRSISDDGTYHELDAHSPTEEIFNSIVMNRYACTRFQRFSEPHPVLSTPSASISNPDIVRQATECIDISRRAPSGFNAQPYRVIMVHRPKEKEALAQFCLGRNADRVRDSDCTMIFLADKEVSRDWKRFGRFLKSAKSRRQSRLESDRLIAKKTLERFVFKAQALVLLFSSGWPLPRILASPLSFLIRWTISCISVVTRRRILVPSLTTAETWATKNTMLVAMTYMLGCTSRGLATCPMEGYNIGGIRKVLQIPKRFTIPIIVSTGIPYSSSMDVNDDAGMSHGPAATSSKADHSEATPRYPIQEVLFDSTYGNSIESLRI
jgi:nitroreductase